MCSLTPTSSSSGAKSAKKRNRPTLTLDQCRTLQWSHNMMLGDKMSLVINVHIWITGVFLFMHANFSVNCCSLEWAEFMVRLCDWVFYTKATEGSVTGHIEVISLNHLIQIGLHVRNYDMFLRTFAVKELLLKTLKLQQLHRSASLCRWTSYVLTPNTVTSPAL